MRPDRAARRELRRAISEAEGREQMLGTIDMSNGDQIQISLFRERGRPVILSIWLLHRFVDGTLHPDNHRGLRFFLSEVPTLARAVAKALEEGPCFARETESG